MTDIIINNIYTKIDEYVDDTNGAEIIKGLFEDLLIESTNDDIETINDYETDISNAKEIIISLQQKLSTRKEELVKRKTKIIEMNKTIRYVAIVREHINHEFNRLWYNCVDLEHNYDELSANFISNERWNTLKYNKGVKYALLILNNIIVCIPKEVCMFYLEINNKFHPEINKRDVTTAITNLKKSSKDGNVPYYYAEIPLNDQILDQVEKFLM